MVHGFNAMVHLVFKFDGNRFGESAGRQAIHVQHIILVMIQILHGLRYIHI